MKEWCVFIDWQGEAKSIHDPDDVNKMIPSHEKEQQTVPEYQHGRVFFDKTSRAVYESCKDMLGAKIDRRKHRSWYKRKATDSFHFMTYAPDELGAYVNLQKWLEKHR